MGCRIKRWSRPACLSGVWMSTLLLPAPVCMLLYYIQDRFISSASGRLPIGRWPLVAIPLALVLILVLASAVGQEWIVGQKVTTVTGLEIGLFAIIAIMAGIVAGGIGLRLMRIDEEYKRVIDNMVKDWETMEGVGNDKQTTSTPQTVANYQHDKYVALAKVRGRREANRRGVLVDGISMFMASSCLMPPPDSFCRLPSLLWWLPESCSSPSTWQLFRPAFLFLLVVGLTTALGVGPGLHVSAVVTFFGKTPKLI